MQEVKGISSNLGLVSSRGFERFFHVNFSSTNYLISRTGLLSIFFIVILLLSIKLNVYVYAHNEGGILYKSQ